MTTPYWSKVLKSAEKKAKAGRQPFTGEQEFKASNWVTCACGKQDDRIPLIPSVYEKIPQDGKLRRLGISFSGNIEYANASYERSLDQGSKNNSLKYVLEAKEVLKKIEKRSLEIIRSIK